MKNTSRVADVSLSAEDVLAVINDWYRFSQHFDPEVAEGFELTYDTSVEEWTSICDLLPDEQLGRALNARFLIMATDEQWIEILHLDNKLRTVCEFISSTGANRVSCDPLQIAGKACDEAGIFIALRSMLVQSGLSVSRMRPSDALGPILDEHLGVLLNVVAKMAPGALPIPTSRFAEHFGTKVQNFLVLAAVLLALVYVSSPESFGVFASSIGVLFALTIGWCRRGIKQSFGSDLHLEGLRTVGDLCRFIVQYRRLI